MISSLRTRLRALCFSAAIVAVSGCAVPNTVPVAAPPVVVTPAHVPILRGTVQGGQQPVSGALIQLYTVAYGADGTPGTQLLNRPVYTGASGGFDITGLFTCPPAGAVVYLTATGGNPGLAAGTNNPAIAAMVMLDVCGTLTPDKYINVNELTTAASVIAYGQFFSQFPYIGTSTSNAAPNYNDVLYFDMLANSASGTAPGKTFPSGQQFPFPTLLSMANIIATCINSAGGVAGDGSPCGNLFALTTPPGGSAPTNTVDALVNMQRNPTLNVPQIFALTTPSAPFQPAATSAPANWYLRLTTGAPATPRYTLCTTWGDSLTLGSEDSSGITLADTLPTLPSCYWGNNQGVGGQTSEQIGIREGGIAPPAAIAGGVIPASGPVNIDFTDGHPPVGASGPGYTPGTISGVAGKVSYDYSQGTTIFTRNTPGVPVASPANATFQATITTENSGFVVLWAGRNDSDNSQTSVLNNLAAMVAALPSPKHFVILSLPNRNDDFEYIGGIGYNELAATNQAIANAYPNNYIDEQALVIAAYDPTSPEDVIDHNHGVPPTSMRSIDEFGDLLAAINPTTCTFTVENGRIDADYTMNLEQEKIRILASDGINVTSCIRGYASTTAVAHAAQATYTGVDFIHLNHLADVIIAKAVDNYIQTH